MKEFNEQEAIRLEKIARPIVKADPIAMFASEEDLLIYEHFFINGLEAERERMAEQLKQERNEIYWRAHKQERNNTIDEAIKKVNELSLCADPIFQVCFYAVVNELKSLKLKSDG